MTTLQTTIEQTPSTRSREHLTGEQKLWSGASQLVKHFQEQAQSDIERKNIPVTPEELSATASLLLREKLRDIDPGTYQNPSANYVAGRFALVLLQIPYFTRADAALDNRQLSAASRERFKRGWNQFQQDLAFSMAVAPQHTAEMFPTQLPQVANQLGLNGGEALDDVMHAVRPRVAVWRALREGLPSGYSVEPGQGTTLQISGNDQMLTIEPHSAGSFNRLGGNNVEGHSFETNSGTMVIDADHLFGPYDKERTTRIANTMNLQYDDPYAAGEWAVAALEERAA